MNETISIYIYGRVEETLRELTGRKSQERILMEQTEREAEEKTEEGKRSIDRMEMRRQINKLKKGKAAGEDGIKNEAWIYMTEELEKPLAEVMRKVWEKGEIIEDWRKGVIYPIYKKGDDREARNYRGITLLDTGYKIYASIVNES